MRFKRDDHYTEIAVSEAFFVWIGPMALSDSKLGPTVIMFSIVRLLIYRSGPCPSAQLQSRNNASQLDPASLPRSATAIDPLPSLQRRGLIAVSALASISLIATSSLLVFLTHRFISWRSHYRRPLRYNQYAVLVYNLALADLLQGLGFIISLRWISTNSLHAYDVSCFLQGIWLQIGNPMSGMFVLAIAVHTFLQIMLNYQLGHRAFVILLVGLWVLGVAMVIIPIAVVGRYVWLPAIAWVSYPFFRLILCNVHG